MPERGGDAARPAQVPSVEDHLLPAFTSLVTFVGLAAASGDGVLITVT